MSRRGAWAATTVAVAAAAAFANHQGGAMSQQELAQLAATPLVGISLSSSADARTRADGDGLTYRFTSAGYGVRVDYAGGDPGTQVAQVRLMLDGGADALVVGAVDEPTLAAVLALAGARQVPVVPYGPAAASLVAADAGSPTLDAVRAALGTSGGIA